MPTPKVARNLGTLTFHRYRENRRISTIRFQTLKYTQGNYVRHFWGTTPARRLSGTTTPHATTSTSSVRQYTSMAGTAPVTGHCTPYEALHPLRGTTPLTRHHTRYGAPHPLRGSAPHTRHYTPYGAPHPLRGATPVTRRYTRYEAVHPLRGTTPLTRHYTPYGALHPIRRGVMPTDRVQRPQSQEQTRNLRDAGQAALPVGGGAWPDNESTRRAKLAARTARGRAAAHGRIEQPSPTRSRLAPSGPGGTRVRRQLSEAAQLSRRSRWRRRGRLRR